MEIQKTVEFQLPLNIEKKPNVQYPVNGYASRRRFSVSSESFNPYQKIQNNPAKIVNKSKDAIDRITATFAKNILFKNLEEEQRDSLIMEMFEKQAKEGEDVVRQGDDGDNFYVIDEGYFEVEINNEVVAVLASGRSFGEIALMYNLPRMATVRAKTSGLLWGMDRETFQTRIMIASVQKRELYESFLQKVPILESLLPYERSTIADALEPELHEKDKVIIKQGEEGSSFYIVEKGELIVTKSENNQEPIVMQKYSVGDYFGELALITSSPRAATVTTVSQVKLLKMHRQDFTMLMGPCSEILKRNGATYLSYEQKVEELNERIK